ncbi:MAG: hypothetical protein A2W64_00885 [Candidatus Zambryskibacteria bacterium RIFCSPLOWO2_02_39_10]|nr:MAG: hypothetical protein A2W64_00885 [Candidatus Zambryskibacteria bacterium RIFCSPLOWO2_02_39_10]
MDKNLEESGWALAPHNLPREIMEKLVKKKDEYLQISCQEVERAFNVSFEGFESEKIEYIELAKGIARAFLRYDPFSHLLLQAVWRKLSETFGLSSKIKYLTLPYPIIHFPLDTSESGTTHKDGYDYIKDFYTTWTPLNDCFHQPISIIEKTHYKNSFILRKLRAKLKFIDKLILSTKKIFKPDIRLGEFFVWHGETNHAGLLNRSGQTKVSITARFTSSAMMSETTLTTEEIENYTAIENKIIPRDLAQKIIKIFKEIQTQTKEEAIMEKTMDGLVENVRLNIKSWNLSPDESKRLGFVLALWAQRMERKTDANLFYLYAFFSGTDNFYTLQKCLTYVISNFKSEEALKFINFILRDFGSQQSVYIIKRAVKLSGEKGKNLNIEYPIDLPLLKSSLT